jgi:hypothetical protein
VQWATSFDPFLLHLIARHTNWQWLTTDHIANTPSMDISPMLGVVVSGVDQIKT